jgi:hypothetical protein
MSTVNVFTATLKTVPLTLKILKQIPFVGYGQEVRNLLQADPSPVVGWIAGKVMDAVGPVLLIQRGDGDYVLFKCQTDTAKKYKQLFVV